MMTPQKKKKKKKVEHVSHPQLINMNQNKYLKNRNTAFC
jgi:hypothetical protein